MADKHRHPHASRGHLDRSIQDLPRLDRHLPLLLRRAVIHEHVDVRNDVEGDRLGEFLRRHRVVHVQRPRLRPQLVHPLLSRARHGLIRRDHHTLDAEFVVQRLEHQHHLDRRAVRLAMIPRLMSPSASGLTSGTTSGTSGSIRKWLVLSITRQARLGRPRRMHGRDRRPRAEQRDVEPGEVERLEVLDLQDLLIPEADLLVRRPRRRQRDDLFDRKPPLGQRLDDLPPDRPGRPPQLQPDTLSSPQPPK